MKDDDKLFVTPSKSSKKTSSVKPANGSPQNSDLNNVYVEHTWSLQELVQNFSQSNIDDLKPQKSAGLSKEKAAELLRQYGYNKLPILSTALDSHGCYFNTVFGGYIIDPSDMAGLWVSIILYGMIIVMCTLSYWQEREARKVVSGFKNLLPQSCSVIRDGNEMSASAEELVPGDIIKIANGSKVPADARVLYCNQLKLETSSITGESEPIEFQSEVVEKTVTIFESRNVAFNGSYCVDGDGIGVVIRTGVNTVIGQIASMTTGQPVKKSQLEKQIKQLVKFLTFMAISVGSSVFVIGGLVHQWEGIILLVVTAFSVCAVGMIPEGMPATVTSILTLVARRLAARNVYLKRLDIVEALGAANIIASDKTGTLTKNEMTVTDVWYSDKHVTEIDDHLKSEYREEARKSISIVEQPISHLLVAMTICNRAVFEDSIADSRPTETRISIPHEDANNKKSQHKVYPVNGTDHNGIAPKNPRTALVQAKKAMGAPSEVALIKHAEQFVDVHEFRRRYNLVFEVPFNSRRKFHLMIARVGEDAEGESQYLLLMKGAPEILIQKCSTILTAEGESDLDAEKMEQFQKAYDSYAANGRRVIGFVHKIFTTSTSVTFNMDQGNFPLVDLVFVGICAIMDPPRDETEMAIRQCKEAGLKVFMVTGDHHATATAIAKQIGLVTVLPGKEQDWENSGGVPKEKTDYCYDWRWGERCSSSKEVKHGVGMGSGSDVAKEAADIVLVDDNFSSIVGAVEEGRLMFDNIKKLMAYVLTHTFPEVWALVIKFCFGMPVGTTSLIILSIDLGTEILPGIAMCAEPLEGDVMRRPPRKDGDNLIGKALIFYCYGYTAHVQTLGCFLAYCAVFWSHGINISDLWMSAMDYWEHDAPVFVSNGHKFTAAQQMHINRQACSAWQIGVVFGQVFHVFTNDLAVIAEIIILLIYVYMPGVHSFLGGAPVPWQCWAIVAAFGVFVFVTTS
uniref:P-type Cu(+) transporter n=1 Tax=Ditylenchus dipsaci TaxID=166011 RepID=A0A915DWP8_9BILA